MADDQLRIGEQPNQDEPSGEWFRTDDQLAMLLVDVEAVQRGATAKVAAVRRFLQASRGEPDPEPDPGLMRMVLEHLADQHNWDGDRLIGPRSVFEMAATALGRL